MVCLSDINFCFQLTVHFAPHSGQKRAAIVRHRLRKMDRATERVQSTDKERSACWNLNTWSTSKLVRGRLFDLCRMAWFVESWLETNLCYTQHTQAHLHTRARTHTHVKDILCDFNSLLKIMCVSCVLDTENIKCSAHHVSHDIVSMYQPH